jgi:YVTN family beta-propeller protein
VLRIISVVFILSSLSGCGSGSSTPKERLVVTADWLNQSLSLLDYEKLVGGASAGEALVDTIDLSDWDPGPLEIEITPDGATAVVSISPGFFGSVAVLIGSPPIPDGGTLLLVDLASRAATELVTADVPLGIAISPDGTRAYTANYGTTDTAGTTLSIIDIPNKTVLADIEIGARPEQVALSPDGSVGIVNLAGEGGIRVFETADVEGTLSPIIETGSDPSDVSFLDTKDRAVVTNSLSATIVLLDTSDPSAPMVVDTLPVPLPPYGVTYVPERDEILAPNGITADLVRLTHTAPDSLSETATLDLPGGAFPLAAITGPGGNVAFVAHLVDHKLTITDLAAGTSRAIEWLTEPGPTYVAIQP